MEQSQKVYTFRYRRNSYHIGERIREVIVIRGNSIKTAGRNPFIEERQKEQHKSYTAFAGYRSFESEEFKSKVGEKTWRAERP